MICRHCEKTVVCASCGVIALNNAKNEKFIVIGAVVWNIGVSVLRITAVIGFYVFLYQILKH